MNSAKNRDPFPQELPWEEFTQYRVTIEELRERVPRYDSVLALSFLANRRTPILPVNAIENMLMRSSVTLSEKDLGELNRDLHAIGLWYLQPAARKVADADPDAIRRVLKILLRLAPKIARPLLDVLALLPASSSRHLGQIGDWKESGHTFDVEMIRKFVRALPELTKRLAADVAVHGKGRRPNFVLDHSASLAVEAFERAGFEVVAHSAAGGRQPWLSGNGASLFVAFFKELDVRISENSLAQSLRRSQRWHRRKQF